MSFLINNTANGNGNTGRRRGARVTFAADQAADNDMQADFDAIQSDGSDGEGSETKRARGPRQTFLPLVSPAPSSRRATTARANANSRHPFVRKFAGTRLQSDTPKYAFTYRSGMTKEPQYMSTGMIRGTIATMPLSELKTAVAYMLEHPDPEGRRSTMLGRPANFEQFEKLRDTLGGRDILLHEIFKEDDDVLSDLYQIAGRVVHRGTRSRTIGQKAADVLGGAVSANSALVGDQDIPYVRQRRPPGYRPALNRTEYRAINVGSVVPLLANIGGPNDDPRIFTPQPARSINGRVDGNPLKPVPLCDKELDRFFLYTANEAQRSGLPLERYQTHRDALSEFSRMCPVQKGTVDSAIDNIKRGRPTSAPAPLDEETIRRLEALGFPREEIDRVWGPDLRE
ncbi:hypothetical protein pmac_cds_340 [Pandoravirus macleodensis]|uniref:Uncharacterized protein n=1 Tax=Pandoravirus macleodensis TaxID=2107707 RepID=A0A2U7UEY6_9VIRU|nr:hypothetical protein pmac_cds_340 [Pandoravirus macleodensis]AVK77028.1 hypothetical protein pmac_cds_340 [Pandoravirus macleodensis]UMO79706.1 hypothetical protein [Pandoravirus aubagnensis]